LPKNHFLKTENLLKMKKNNKNLFSATPRVAKKGTSAMLCMILSGLFLIGGCKKDNSNGEKEPDYPIEIPFTEYSLPETCQWTNLTYDNTVIVINSEEKLNQYVTSTDGVYPKIDFSKHTLLLANGVEEYLVIPNYKNLQQLSIQSYVMKVDLLPYMASVITYWHVPIIVNKIADDSVIELNVTTTIIEPEITLQGISWKLIRFVDTETEEMKEPIPPFEERFHLNFYYDNTLSGFSSSNELCGNYEINDTSKIRISVKAMTENYEYFDGLYYVESLNDVQFFISKENQLMLYYNEGKKYMLFRQKARYMELKMNETSHIPYHNDKITVSFTGVKDGRCPWSACYLCYGSRAEVYLNITDASYKSESVCLWVHGCVINSDIDDEPFMLEMLGYRFQVVNLSPHPDYGININEEDYIATIKIIKK
jgi:hypothetical protein